MFLSVNTIEGGKKKKKHFAFSHFFLWLFYRMTIQNTCIYYRLMVGKNQHNQAIFWENTHYMGAYKRQSASFKRKDKYFDETSKSFQFVEKKISLHFSSLFYSKSLYFGSLVEDLLFRIWAVILFRNVEHCGISSTLGMNSGNSGIGSNLNSVWFRNQFYQFLEFRNWLEP
jgi:hypothetical protein